MKVLLIGCGQTGGAIAFELVKTKYVEKLGLYSRTVKSSKALAFDLHNSKVSVLENLEDIEKYNYVVIALSGISDSEREKSFKDSRTSYQVRQDELKYNLGAVAGLIPFLKKLPRKTGIVVVTNPVDEMTNYLRISLNHQKIFGFGMELDVRRYSKVLGKIISCIGIHGKAVPLINSSSPSSYEEIYRRADNELMDYLRRNGIPHQAAGKVFVEFFSRLTGKKKEVVHVSYFLKQKFCDVKDISISLPFVLERGEVLGIAPIKVNSIEQKKFQIVALGLKNSVNHILKASLKLTAYR